MISKRLPTDVGAVHPSMMHQQPPPEQHNDGFPPMMMMMTPYQLNQAPPSPAWNQQPIPQQPQPTTTSAEEEVRTLCIWGLQYWMDEAYIHQCFFHHTGGGTGEVFTSKVIRNKTTGESECYGFIEFKTHAAAEIFLHKFNGTPMPRVVVGSCNFCLDWAPPLGGGVEKLQQQDDSADLTIPFGDDDYDLRDEDEDEDVERMQRELSLVYGAPQILLKEEEEEEEEAECCNEEEEEAHGSKSTSTWEDMLKPWSPSGTDKTSSLPEEFALRISRNSYKYRCKTETKIVVHPPIKRSQTVDDAERVREIGALIKMDASDLRKIGAKYLALLDELIELAGSVDIAKELQSIKGGLGALIHCMGITQTGLRGKTAEVISAMVDKYPNSRLLVLEVGLDFLFDKYITDLNGISMVKTLHAIFSLFRNNKEGIALFQESSRFQWLSCAMTNRCVDANFQRKILNLIHCLLHENNSEHNMFMCNMVTKLGFHRIMMHLAYNDDADVREAALRCLLVLTRVEEGGNSEQLVKNDDDLKHFLQQLIEGISAIALEDLDDDAREEIRLVDSLWNACYNKPSSLREKGLYMLPDEDLSLSDLAIKLFEPPLRTGASAGEKKKAPFLFGIGPRSATPTF